jgi:maleate cis-trans isomerase
VIPGLEAELGLPVFGSNLALAWHMAVTAGAAGLVEGPYALLRG